MIAKGEDAAPELVPGAADAKPVEVDPCTLQVHSKCMTVKTITIDMEAYTLLAGRKGSGESFSQVIKRLVRQHGGSAASLRAQLKDVCLDADTLVAIEKTVANRDSDYSSATFME